MNQKVNILIVEDEFMIAEDIALRLEEFGYDISGQADSGENALEILDKGETDLALLDVNLNGEMDGIELARIINERYKIPFIFLTSLASKTIVERAKETAPSSYLLKPFNDRQVQIAIDIALNNFSKKETTTEINPINKYEHLENNVISMKDSLFLKKDSSFNRVRFNDIKYLTAEGNYTTIFTSSGRFIYSNVLKNFEEKLPDDIFYRVHRSFIVNANAITGFEGNYLHVEDRHIPVSKKFREKVFRAFKTI